MLTQEFNNQERVRREGEPDTGRYSCQDGLRRHPVLDANEQILIGTEMKNIKCASAGEIRVTYQNRGVETFDWALFLLKNHNFW